MNRKKALMILNSRFTDEEKELLRMVIETADVQGSWRYIEEEGSVCEDDVQSTLRCLAEEFEIKK